MDNRIYGMGKKHIHIIGIAGTFMVGIASLAKQLGYKVTGVDKQCYPPVSDLLKDQDIHIDIGYDSVAKQAKRADLYLIGNALSRGNEAVEWILQNKLSFTSGAQWLQDTVLQDKQVLAVTGTHGKTTTSSMLAWILEFAGKNPGFLVGGAAQNFNCSARATTSKYFVIEADEYDTAFFDKQPKFMHYWPSTLIINNLEFDHADIYQNLQEIQTQFSYLLRLIAKDGYVIAADNDLPVQEVLNKGCWSNIEYFGAKTSDWYGDLLDKDGSCYQVWYKNKVVGQVQWSLIGEHNVNNAIAAIAASHTAGVNVNQACQALALFKSPKRRLEKKLEHQGIVIYDDFAHHPTAIATTLASLRAKYGEHKRLLCVLELGSYTMRHGYHQQALPQAIKLADKVYIYAAKQIEFNLDQVIGKQQSSFLLFYESSTILQKIIQDIKRDDLVVLMSNSSFGGLSEKIIQEINAKEFKVSLL